MDTGSLVFSSTAFLARHLAVCLRQLEVLTLIPPFTTSYMYIYLHKPVNYYKKIH